MRRGIITRSRLVGFCLIISSIIKVGAQPAMPAVMDTASIQAQLEYLHERTNIYNGFRAIREDIFQKMKTNVSDSLNSVKTMVASLNDEMTERESQIENQNSELIRAREERDQAIRTKDSFSFFGLQLQKGLYNTILWIVVLGLVALAVILFLMFKRSFLVTTQTKKELASVQEEFDEYRKASREKYEKLVVAHHNEIMKLKRG